MKSLNDLLNFLQSKNMYILRVSDDIDIYYQNLDDAIAIVKNIGFIITNKQNNFIEAVKFIDDKLIILEITNNLLPASYFEVKLRDEYLEKYIDEPKQNDIWQKAIRYLLSLRNDKKSKSFFSQNKQILKENNYFLDYLINNPFKSVDIDLLLENKYKFVIKCVGLNKLFKMSIKKIIFHLKSFFNTKTIAIIGVDGAGKTTIIENLKQYNIKSIYMGFREFKFENFYNKIIGKNLFFTFLVHLCVFFENYIRVFKILKYKLLGYNVVVDRYPKIEYQIGGFNNKVFYYLFYKLFFPKIKTIMLYADEDIIYKRKQELSKEEIKKEQEQLKKIVDIKIRNIDIDNTLNKILKEIYG